MAINPENRDALESVELILLNDRIEKTCLDMKLPLDTARNIAWELYVKIPFTRILLHEGPFEKEKENLMIKIKDKFFPVSKLPTLGPVEGIVDIPISLNALEIDFLNGIYLETINLARQAGKEGWYSAPEQKFLKDMITPAMQKDMADFVTLNCAFIQAGGQARPEYITMLG